MASPERIAVVIGKMVGGGVESTVMNYYRNLDKSKFQFDFIIDSDSTKVPEKEIRNLGGRIYRVSPYQILNRNMQDLDKIFKKNSYKIVHAHLNTLNVFPLRVAKKNCIPVRISHNHSMSSKKEFKKNIIKQSLKHFSTSYATHFMAPTLESGHWLFGNIVYSSKFLLLRNAIDLSKFNYNVDSRNYTREKLGFDNSDFVIGTIGRMVWQKNQMFLLKVFEKAMNRNDNVKLLIIGDGPLLNDLKDYIDSNGLNSNVIIIGYTEKIESFYQAMDFFVFPSNYEGLGMVAVEAQACGLQTLVSNNVPLEAKISNLIQYKNLEDGVESWSNAIVTRRNQRESKTHEARSCGYDIKLEAQKLTAYYSKIMERNR